MKFLHLRKILPFIFLLSALLIIDCDNKWDEHYNQESFDLPENNLKELIEGNTQLSTFYKMLESSGYDKIINESQSYTVWAPVNDALNGIDITDTKLVNEIVKNHITRGQITTSDVDILPIRMLSGKIIDFAIDGNGYRFGGTSVINSNGVAANGLVHIIDGFEPFINNLWEYIGEYENLDSLRTYLYGLTKEVFVPERSTEYGVNDDNQIIYSDSVFDYSNIVLDKLGTIDNEDSTYTLIIPDNTAWNEAYNRIEGFFNFPENGGGQERKHTKTQYTLVQDMFFRGRIKDPESQNSLVSTQGNIYYNPGQLYTNVYETTNLSNGIANITYKMPFADTSSWYKEIRVEAEEIEGRESINGTVFPRNSYGSGMDVSGNKYIYVDPPSNGGSSVKFSIPNTLSAKYNIYCVFVPASISDISDFTPTKVKFELTYITLENGAVWYKDIIPDLNTTSPLLPTKMFVDQFDFKYANIIDDEYEDVVVKLKVINDVTPAEAQAGDYSYKMNIDCIILEPVLE